MIGQVMKAACVRTSAQGHGSVTLGDDTGFLRLRFSISASGNVRPFRQVCTCVVSAKCARPTDSMVHPEYKAFPTKPDARARSSTPVIRPPKV